MACETAACDDRRSPIASLGYTPRQAERTVLHQLVREHLETFLATTARADPAGLPAFLEQEFRAFLECGIWSRGFNLKTVKGTPKLVPFTQGVRDALATRTLALTALAAVLDVSPAQPGTNAPADFSDDPTRTGSETNRFKCYTVSRPKGAPKFVPPPADVDGATPGAETRDSLLVCYGVKLPKGAKFPRQMIGTRSRTVGVRIVGRRKPVELCVVAGVFPGS